ncbi:IMPACT family member yigZ [Corynebacterium renale]|uniref:YigZ family protein n=1 Tax=Corynebacterium renale TaxID=1724 RepID=UPI000DA2F2FE|nr:YigZ family protein [Corynebacterium renale]SQG64964.1 IMPACT family member yigZ [Corynebacterium renale]STC96894.1 IMPACT family member yigZ [Corynebacterium renale]
MTSYQLPAPEITFTDEVEIKRSRFITFIRRVSNSEEARAFIHEIKGEYPDARHHCSAFIHHVEDALPVERSSDDGEPSGTAGAPMLEQLKGSGMLDIAAVVVRYFGGIKLGAGGLVHAYSNAVGATLPKVTRYVRAQKELAQTSAPHAAAGKLEADIRARGITVTDVSYGAEVTITMATEPGSFDALEDTLAALTAGHATLKRAGTAWVEYPAVD